MTSAQSLELPLDISNQEVAERDDITKLYRDVLQYRNGKKFQQLLDFCVRFRKLSAFNAALLMAQRPGCRYALTSYRWLKYYDRLVKSDACPLMILCPFGPVGFLFDLGDTVPKPGCPDRIPNDLTRNFDFKQRVDPWLFKQVIGNLAYWGILYGKMTTGQGYYGKLQVWREQDGQLTFPLDRKFVVPDTWSPAYTIKIRDGTDDTNAFGTILHEMGHLTCRHIHCSYEKPWGKKFARTELSHEQEEFEAQTVSWLVGHRIGLDIPSTYGYLAEYLGKDKELPDVDLSVVLQATNEVEKLLHPCTIKDGWLWKYSPSLQEAFKRLNPPKVKEKAT